MATRVVVHGYSDVVTTQDEVFWVVRVSPFEVDTAGHTELELLTMTADRWWTRHELEATPEPFWPRDLLTIWSHADGLVDSLVADSSPLALDLGTVEESTIPA